MGPAIRESVAETFAVMMQQMNQLMENSFSARAIKWRIDAFRTNRSFAEVMLTETFVYQVEHMFLIHRESSLLINHLTSANAIVKDPDMVSSMLTVVTDFVKDSFVVDRQQNVKSIKFGQLNLLF
jgi:OOP family OmpA-OmpF porin